jgi:hypothetical protein
VFEITEDTAMRVSTFLGFTQEKFEFIFNGYPDNKKNLSVRVQTRNSKAGKCGMNRENNRKRYANQSKNRVISHMSE